MGRYFSDIDDFYSIMEQAVARMNYVDSVREGLTASNLLLKFKYRDYGVPVLLDFRGDTIGLLMRQEAQNAPDPDVEFILETDTANEFFNGALNVPLAIATRKLIAKGSIPKALKLLPVIKPAFPLYREMLKEIGRHDLIIEMKKTEARGEPFAALIDKLRSMLTAEKKRPTSTVETLGPKLPVRTDRQEENPGTGCVCGLPENFNALKIEMLRRMHLIRAFEEHLARAFADGELPTEMIHLSIGQEASAVGACFALSPADWINTTHRGHGHILAKGADVNRVMAELYGKEEGICKGRGGSMHVIDLSCGVMGSNGIVGAGLLLANGAAMSARHHQTGNLSAAFFGDGATNQGMFHEACNFAAVFRLPVIFICENNLYGEFTPFGDHCAADSVAARAVSYGMPSIQVDGNDVMAVYEATRQAAERARSGAGPTLIEARTYRWRGHMEGEPTGYRTEEEIESWKKKDPIARHEASLIEADLLNRNDADEMKEEAARQIAKAVRFAKAGTEPDTANATAEIYAPERPEVVQGTFMEQAPGPSLALSTAINQAIAEEMERDSNVFMLGEDVRLGGYFGVSQGLADRFGKERILDTPISEYAIVGAAVGAAATGLRPIAEILFSDFLTTCADPLVNQAAKLRYMSGGQNRVPMVVRTPVGGYIGAAAQHSQCFEGLFAGLPGLIVCAPSEAYTAKGILKSAIRSDNPVLFFEHKLLYAEASPVPDGEYLLPLGKARIRRRGTDITIVGILYGAHLASLAGEILGTEGISCEVIDPVTLYPLDLKTLLESVRKTGRLLVVEEAHGSFGFGARIVSAVAEYGFGFLKAAPARVSAMDSPIPYNKALELFVLPDVDRVVEAARAMKGQGVRN